MDAENKLDEITQDSNAGVVGAMMSPLFDKALADKLPDNADHQERMISPFEPDQYGGSRTIPNTPKPWEVRPSGITAGKLQIYLPAGTSCLYLNANAVPPATSLSVTATGATPDVAGYYEVNISDSAGPLVLYRWFEPESGADGRWLLSGHGQWNMAAWSSGPLPFPATGCVQRTIIAVKTTDGVWIPCDNGCSEFHITAGDAECALGYWGGTTLPSAPKSIDNDGSTPPGSGGLALQLYRLQAGSLGTLAGPAGETPGDLVVCAIPNPDTGAIETGLKRVPSLTNPGGGDWSVFVDDVDEPSVLEQNIPTGSWINPNGTFTIFYLTPL